MFLKNLALKRAYTSETTNDSVDCVSPQALLFAMCIKVKYIFISVEALADFQCLETLTIGVHVEKCSLISINFSIYLRVFK